MVLRDLELQDAELMLEWMHDSNVIRHMQNNFINMTLDDCIGFIRKSTEDKNNVHKAIQDEDGNYLGTISLKHIDYVLGIAEFAITVRACAMGTGVSTKAMSEIIQYGFNNIGLKAIYWCVSNENLRAVRFYDKNGYERIALRDVPNDISCFYADCKSTEFIWFAVRQ